MTGNIGSCSGRCRFVACLSTDLPEPGSFHIYDDLDIPIVVIRGKDSEIRAFLNICRIVRAGDPYGIWHRQPLHLPLPWLDFRHDRKAIGIPEESQFCGEIGDRKHLVPCPAEERHGLVFVQASPNSTMDSTPTWVSSARNSKSWGSRRRFESRTTKSAFVRTGSTRSTPISRIIISVAASRHFANVFAHNLCMLETWGPHQRFTFPQRSIHDWMNKEEDAWDIDSLPVQHLIFPNTVLTLGSVSRSGSLVTMHRLFPTSVSDLTTKVSLFSPSGQPSPEQQAEIDANFKAIMGAVKDEDYSVTGEAYLSLSALPAGTRFPIGRQEIGTQNFHRNVESLVSA